MPERNPLRQLASDRQFIPFAWGAACAAALALVWLVGLSLLAAERSELTERVLQQQGASARQQALEVAEFVQGADQLLVLLRDEAERGGDPFRLERFATGVLRGKTSRVLIADADGHILLNSRRARNTPALQDYPPFLAHRASPYRGFRAFERVPDRDARGRSIIGLSRRIDRPDGRFAGIVVIETSAPELMAEARPLPAAAIALQMVDGQQAWAAGDRHEQLELGAASLNLVPTAYAGQRIEPGDSFTDGITRALGWSMVDGAPMVVVASADLQAALAQHGYRPWQWFGMLFGSSLLLLLAAAGAARSHLRRHERHVRQQQVRAAFRQAADGTLDAMFTVRPVQDGKAGIVDFLVDDCNEQAARRVGLTRDQMLGRTFRELMSRADNERIHGFMLRVVAEGLVEDEIEIARPQEPGPGRFAGGWIHRRGLSTDGGLAITVRDISESREQQAAMAAMAVTDALTALPNRRWLVEHLQDVIARGRRQDKMVALLFIDLDNFKAVNDTMGHEAGDAVLRDIGACLRASVRGTDTVVRLGGDEFTVLAESLDSLADAEARAERLIAAVNRLNAAKPWGAFAVTASVGIAVAPLHTSDAHELLQFADIAMYSAKSAGKAQFCSFAASFAEELQRRVQLQQDLARAIGTEQLLLHFQPRVDVFSGRLTALEALVRWQHPVHGLLMPQEFIPLAEERGLIVALGEWVLCLLCRQLRAWQDAGLGDCRVAFNVSELQLRSDRFRLQLITQLARHGLPVSRVALELTESALGEDGNVLTSEIQHLRDLTVSIEIDDFGTGMSSLSRLQRLQVDVLKIDKSFIHALGRDQRSDALCSAILSLGQSLGITVVAEGVETPVQLEHLRRLGCHEVQGYLISRPLPADEVEPLMRRPTLLEPVEPSLVRFRRSP